MQIRHTSHAQRVMLLGFCLGIAAQSIHAQPVICYEGRACSLLAGPGCIPALNNLVAVDTTAPAGVDGYESAGGRGCGIHQPIPLLPFLWWRCGPPLASLCFPEPGDGQTPGGTPPDWEGL